MPDVIEIGGFALNGMLLTALIAAFAGYGALWLWSARARASRSGPWGDMMAGAAVIAIVIWKFGVLFREPSLLWEQPRLLLVIIGSSAEAAAGLAAAGLFWIWLACRYGIGLLSALDALAVAATGGLLAWNVLSAFEYRWGYAVVCAVLLALLIGRRAREEARAAGAATGEAGSGTGESAGEMSSGSAYGAAGNTSIFADRSEAAQQDGGASGTVGEGTAAVEDGTAGITDDRAAGITSDSTRKVKPANISTAGNAAILAGYVLGAGCLAVSLFAAPPPWVKPPMFAGLTGTQLLFIAACLAAAVLDAYKGRSG